MRKHGGTILRMSRSARLEAPSQVGSLLVYRARELIGIQLEGGSTP